MYLLINAIKYGKDVFYVDVTTKLEENMKHSKIPPMINQIETHPEFPQNELHEYLTKHKILHEAWAPLGQGNKSRCRRSYYK